jgi:hypothetical protein
MDALYFVKLFHYKVFFKHVLELNMPQNFIEKPKKGLYPLWVNWVMD